MDRVDALRLFARLADRRSFSAAARDLKIKQSTASKWVAELEAQLGTSLVERTTRALHLTDAGRRLLARSADVLAAFDDLADEFRAAAPEPAGRLRVSLPEVFGRLYVIPALVPFLKAHPRVEAELILSDRYVNLVEEGFDVAVRIGVPVDTSARGRKLADSGRTLVAAPGYLAARGRPAQPGDLKGHDCLVHGQPGAPTVWRFARGGGASVPVSVRGRIAVSNSEAVLMLAKSGLGIALLADFLVAEDLKKKRLVALLPDHAAPRAPIHALTPPGRFTSTTVRAFVDHLARVIPTRLAA